MSPIISNNNNFEGIAIIGMAGRFPGADSVRQFWQNLCNGIESIITIKDEDLRNAGVDEELIKNPLYVKRIGAITGVDLFDANFFGINPREAELIDPQHRLFLECAWESLEDAGYDPEKYEGLIGLYAGNGMNHYLLQNIVTNLELINTVGDYQTMIGNANDFLTTRVSYKLNLKGPSITLLTACSTSMVAVHAACQSLLTYQCDMALAGGVSLKIPPGTGYLYKEGHILSPDGHCRAFDIGANGTAWGEGLGIVVLKRLEDAVNDHDTIYAVIKSTALNNDGSNKVGFTAPSVDGQATVIAMAQALADVDPESISYIEAHGTATPMGDPIELAGLIKAFKSDNDKKNYCALGSVKTNIGHLDAAAGVAGLIKTALALKHEQIPPTLHFTKPNPNLNIEQSPFFVNNTLMPWKKSSVPRRAGVSSFGIGGTNAHAILEEAPEIISAPSSKTWHILPLSARSENALDCMTQNLAEFFKKNNDINIADAAHTLQTGRRAFMHRRTIVCQSTQDAINAMETYDINRVYSGEFSGNPVSIAFMFSGQGSQYVNMTRQLYENEPVYKEKLDYCSSIVSPLLGTNLINILFPSNNDYESANKLLLQTQYTQPVLFALEYSLSCLLMNWGIHPNVMIGHSIGEYVAACLSGVFEPADALKLVTERAKIMQRQPPGVMLSIMASEDSVKEIIEKDMEIALVNGPQLCVVGGTEQSIDILDKKLTSANIQHTRLYTSHAFHTFLMDGAIKPFAECVAKTPCHAPVIPFISNVSGTWITADQAQDPMYWASHIRNTVNFSNGAKQLIDNPDTIFIEIGPGSSLYTLVNMQSPSHKPVTAIQTIPHVKQQQHDMEMFYSALGKLWIAGAKINWGNCYGNEQRYKISLPTYPFERQRYWVEPAIITSSKSVPQSTIKNKTTRSNTSQSVSSKSIKHSTHPRPRLSYEYIAPSTDLEKQLVEIWQTILGIEPIGINDNFFDLGGHSLLAVQMFSQIQKKTGQNLSLATLFTASTIKKISLLITKLLEGTTLSSETSSFVSEKNPWKHVVPIKSSGTLPPFFCVHGVGGNVLNYYQFVPFLDVEQPLYGLQCLGLDGISTPFKNVQLMASKYVSEIRKVQPHGPYYLGGGSMGGLVAFEIAQQLVAMEEQIGILLMFDSVCIKLARSGSRPTEPATVQSTDQSSPKKSILSRIRHSIWCRVRDGYKMAVCKKYNLMGKPIPHELRYWLVEQKNLAITTEYFPKPYNGLITMFRATLNKGCSDPNRGWGSVAKGGIKFFDFACEHETMVEEVDVVKKLGEVLRKTR